MITDPIFYLRKNPNKLFTSDDLACITIKSRCNVNKKLKAAHDEGKLVRNKIDIGGFKCFAYQWNKNYKVKLKGDKKWKNIYLHYLVASCHGLGCHTTYLKVLGSTLVLEMKKNIFLI